MKTYTILELILIDNICLYYTTPMKMYYSYNFLKIDVNYLPLWCRLIKDNGQPILEINTSYMKKSPNTSDFKKLEALLNQWFDGLHKTEKRTNEQSTTSRPTS